MQRCAGDVRSAPFCPHRVLRCGFAIAGRWLPREGRASHDGGRTPTACGVIAGRGTGTGPSVLADVAAELRGELHESDHPADGADGVISGISRDPRADVALAEMLRALGCASRDHRASPQGLGQARVTFRPRGTGMRVQFRSASVGGLTRIRSDDRRTEDCSIGRNPVQ